MNETKITTQTKTTPDGGTFLKILDMYVSKDRQCMLILTPFIQGNAVCATNTEIAIAFNTELLQDKLEHVNRIDGSPDVLKIIASPEDYNLNIEFDTSVSRSEIDAFRKQAKETYQVTEINCIDCNGTQTVMFEFEARDGHIYTTEQSCPSCKGIKGKVTYFKDKNTGRLIKKYYELLRIHDGLIKIDLFEILVRTAEMLSVESFKLVFRDDFGNKNQFILGKCIIIIGSVMSYDDDKCLIYYPTFKTNAK